MPARPSIHGVSVSPGLACGPVHVIGARPDVVPVWTVATEQVAGEIARVAAGQRFVADELALREKMVRVQAGEKEAEILGMQRMILQDPRAQRDLESAIREQRVNAETAVQMLIEKLSRTMRGLEGESSRGFAADFSDPWHRVLDFLLQRDREELQAIEERVVLAAADLTPQAATFLPRERILAVITESGGRFSHGAVLVRSLGIPCVIGVPNLLARLRQGMTVTVDGGEGEVQLEPGPAEQAEFDRRQQRYRERRAALGEHASRPARTADGAGFHVMANIEGVRDLETFDPSWSDGVGLFRTEFLYMERTQFPSEEEQHRVYRRVLERMAGRPVMMRTLDIGGDKQLAYFKTPRENNPALGWRGIRISLQWRDLLRVQLRAMLRASIAGDLRILLPMVSSLSEIEETHAIFDAVKADLIEEGYEVQAHIPVGVMVEVPSLLLTLEHVLPYVDFVSVGTNDLVQYLLAVDRDNAWVAKLYDPQHPAVLVALRQVALAARAAAKPCSVCGDMAGDPATAVLLFALGYESVSVAPHFLPEIKYALGRVTTEVARSALRDALHASSSDGVRKVLSALRSRLYDRPTE
jgi:phosphotransferase system enzyme I (PtsI)